MIKEFRKYYYKSIFELFKKELQKIATEFNLEYEELENTYLFEFKKNLKN